MKTTRQLVTLLTAALILVPAGLALGGSRTSPDKCGLGSVVADLPFQEVDEVEEAHLVYMLEEEKLARDVYETMNDLWGMRVFSNIASAEQTHLDAVQGLLDKYGINFKLKNGRGQFVDETLQALYKQLIAQGSASINDALRVGATIEDVDIFDLMMALEETDNLDIQTVFQNLMKGSRNHLRAFNSLLEANGVTYTPQFISQENFDSIVTSAKEQGQVDAFGEPVTTEPCRSQKGQRGPRGRR